MNSVQNPTSEQNITRVHSWCALGMSVAMAFVAAAVVRADVPPDIAAQLKEIGRVVNPAATAKLYRPLQPKAPYPGVTVARDVSFGPDPKNVLDVFTAEKGGSSRPVLIYVPGGAGNKIEPVPDGDAFFDNIMLWAVKNGMTGVNMQRRGGQGLEWNDPAKDVGSVVQWVRQQHRDVQRQSQPSVHLGAFGRQRSGRHLHRSSRALRAEWSRSEGCCFDVRRIQHPPCDRPDASGSGRTRWACGTPGHGWAGGSRAGPRSRRSAAG